MEEKDGPPRRAGGRRRRGRQRDEQEESRVKTRTLRSAGCGTRRFHYGRDTQGLMNAAVAVTP